MEYLHRTSLQVQDLRLTVVATSEKLDTCTQVTKAQPRKNENKRLDNDDCEIVLLMTALDVPKDGKREHE